MSIWLLKYFIVLEMQQDANSLLDFVIFWKLNCIWLEVEILNLRI